MNDFHCCGQGVTKQRAAKERREKIRTIAVCITTAIQLLMLAHLMGVL